MDKAEKYITKQLPKNGARGNATAAAKARWTTKSINTPNDLEDKPVDTLKRILMHDKTTFDNGFDLINTYVEQNVSHEMLKSMVIKCLALQSIRGV